MYSVVRCPACNCPELCPQTARCEPLGIEIDQATALLVGLVSVSVPPYPPKRCCRVTLVLETLSPARIAAAVVGGATGDDEAGPPDAVPLGVDEGVADDDLLADGLLPGVAVGVADLAVGLTDGVADGALGEPLRAAFAFAPPDVVTVGCDNPTQACKMPVE